MCVCVLWTSVFMCNTILCRSVCVFCFVLCHSVIVAIICGLWEMGVIYSPHEQKHLLSKVTNCKPSQSNDVSSMPLNAIFNSLRVMCCVWKLKRINLFFTFKDQLNSCLLLKTARERTIGLICMHQNTHLSPCTSPSR